MQYFNELMAKIIKASQTDQEAARKMRFDLDQLPTLDFREASLSESWNSAAVDLLVLSLLLACFFMIAYVGFVRSDVR